MKQKIQNFSQNLPKITKQQAILVVGITIALGVLFVFFFISSRTSKDAERTIAEGDNALFGFILTGGPRIEKKELSSRTIQHTEELKLGDKIVTDSISKAMLIFSDNSFIVFDSNSTAEFISIQQNDESTTEFKVTSGRVFIRVNDTDQYNPSFTLNTEIVKTSSSSTGYELVATEDGGVKFVVKSGEITISSTDEEEEFSSFKIQTGSEITLTTANLESTSDLSSLIKPTTIESTNDEFKLLYDCLDTNVGQMLQGGNNVKLNFIKNQADILVNCQFDVDKTKFAEGEEKRMEEALKKFQSDTQNLSKKSPEITFVTASFVGSTVKCSWDAKGDNISSYQYSIGKAAGSTNVFDWKETKNKSEEIDIAGLNYGQFYYCNVKAKNNYGDSAVKSSEGVLFDNSTANINSSSLTFPPGPVKGTVNYENIPDDDDLKVEFYIQSKDGKYLNASGDWQTGQVLLSTSKNSGNNKFTFSSDSISGDSSDFSGGKLYIQVTNTLTGRTLDQTLVTIP